MPNASFAAASSPITPASAAVPPSEATLRATLPAPPSMAISRVRASTGIGASGDVRVTSP